MKHILFILLLFFYGCSSKTSHPKQVRHIQTNNKILKIGDKMIKNKEIIRGGCWNYIDTLYARAGYPRSKRVTIFKTAKNRPPYAPAKLIRQGDWLYYINHSYKKVTHSGVFVKWHNKPKRQAIILSYAGERRKKPARYKIYNIKNVFTIIRGKN